MSRLRKVVLAVFILAITALFLANIWVVLSTTDKLYTDLSAVDSYEVGLVLGTSDKRSSGEDNPFFTSRIEAAAALYNAGKVKYLIVSGDNRSKYYNEPQKMQQALISKGVPANVITMDYAGLRTLDSVIRCKEVFEQEEVIIITQGFHCHRALFISRYYNMNAIGFATDKLPLAQSLGVILRETLARPMAILDTYILNKQPKHLGDRELINRGKI